MPEWSPKGDTLYMAEEEGNWWSEDMWAFGENRKLFKAVMTEIQIDLENSTASVKQSKQANPNKMHSRELVRAYILRYWRQRQTKFIDDTDNIKDKMGKIYNKWPPKDLQIWKQDCSDCGSITQKLEDLISDFTTKVCMRTRSESIGMVDFHQVDF